MKKQFLAIILIAFFVGATGSIVIGRFLIPYLATVKGWGFLSNLATTSPIVVNHTQQVQLNEGVNLTDLAKQAGSATVSLYTSDANPNFLGNGIIMTSDGLIFSAKTVVNGRTSLTAVLDDGTSYKALVRAVDPKSDIAALTIDKNNLSAVSFANAQDLEVGQRVLSIGESSFPFTRSLAQGFVTNTSLNTMSQLGKTFSTEVLEDEFEMDAVVNNGRFVGGPIINLNGRLVGMVKGSAIQKIVAAENLQTALNSYLSNGKIIRPRLGLTYFNVSKTVATLKSLPRAGVQVAKVDDGSPASGKLLVNDLIFGVDGQSLENQSFEQIINRHALGEIKFRLLRAGVETEVSVTLVATK